MLFGWSKTIQISPDQSRFLSNNPDSLIAFYLELHKPTYPYRTLQEPCMFSNFHSFAATLSATIVHFWILPSLFVLPTSTRSQLHFLHFTGVAPYLKNAYECGAEKGCKTKVLCKVVCEASCLSIKSQFSACWFLRYGRNCARERQKARERKV